MKKANNLFAIAFAVIGILAFIGAAFQGATWHYATVVMCVILVILFLSENTPQAPGLSGQ